MSFCRMAATFTEQMSQMIARVDGVGQGAWMTLLAVAANLACRNAGQADARALRAPDRPVTLPNPGGGAGERLSAWHYCGEDE